MSAPVTTHRKRGTNRGRPRLWIEGAHLKAAGFAIGDRFNLIPTPAGFNLVAHPEGARKVSGKKGVPIIDITGAALGALQTVERIALTYTAGTAHITATEATA